MWWRVQGDPALKIALETLWLVHSEAVSQTTNDQRQVFMADTFQLEIVTPEKMVVKDAAEEMQLPGKNGYLGILPGHALWLELAALAGFVVSALMWLIVAVATPAPTAVVDVARLGARRVHDRLPAEIRERLPEDFRLKITGS